MAENMALEVSGNIGWLRFVQPKKRNSFSLGFAADLVACLDEANKRDDVRAVIMSGGENFCGGGDLKEFQSIIAEGARASLDLMGRVNVAATAAYTFPKPLIAAVRGAAFGAGMSLAMAADLIVAADTSRFCQAFIRVGGCPDTGSSWLLQRRVGAGMARKLTLTGRAIDGQTAAEIGLADEVVADSQVDDTARALALEIAPHSMFGLTSAKKTLREAAESGFREALEIEGLAQALLLQGHDFPEAMTAFIEKRAPVIRDS